MLNTDIDISHTLGDMFDAEIWLKFENLQFTAAYKERGALNKLASLTAQERACGVIAMSAGNHAQGVAYHARRLGIPATIVMPTFTPTVKIENTRKLGAIVILEGASFEDASAFATTYGAARGMTFIHPFDDPIVIAGQGTVALEMLAAVPQLDTLVVPIGGGGLISGVAIAAKSINPKIRIIGVEAQLYPSMLNAVKGSKLPVGGDTLAEGIAVTTPGRITRRIIEALVDDIVLVSEADLERAVTLLPEVAGPGPVTDPDRAHQPGAGGKGQEAVAETDEPTRGDQVLKANAAFGVVLDLDHLTAPLAQRFGHSPEVLLANVDCEPLDRLHPLAVDLLDDGLRTGHFELVTLAAHGLDEHRKVELAAPAHQKALGRLGLLEVEAEVGVELLEEPCAQLPGGRELALTTREW